MTSSNIVRHTLNHVIVEQDQLDGYMQLNQLAQASGKRLDNWFATVSTKELLAEFDKQAAEGENKLPGIQGSYPQALVIKEGRNGGTWAHPLITIQFAQWCSAAFALERISRLSPSS